MGQGYGGPPQGGWGQPGGQPGFGNQPAQGYGAPPAGQGYGAPPGGAYGAPPGGGGYGAPPGGGFAPPAGGGGRVNFVGQGGDLLVTFLINFFGPIFGGGIIASIMIFIATGMASAGARTKAAGATSTLALLLMLFGGLIAFTGYIVALALGTHKLNQFHFDNTTIDGKRLSYTATLGEHIKITLVNVFLINLTFGIYFPWAYVKARKFSYEKTLVDGQPGLLTFNGDPSALLGKYIVGQILIMCTGGIYFPWFLNDIFAFNWENTQYAGQAFGFKKDPGGLFGTYLLNMLILYCTGGIYTPWMLCNIWKWENEHVL